MDEFVEWWRMFDSEVEKVFKCNIELVLVLFFKFFFYVVRERFFFFFQSIVFFCLDERVIWEWKCVYF